LSDILINITEIVMMMMITIVRQW